MIPSASVLAALATHAEAQQPRECCGLVVEFEGVQSYVSAVNLSPSLDHFDMAPEVWPHAEEIGKVVAIAHSHPYTSPEPSMADLVGCTQSGLPWLILSWPTLAYRVVQPEPRIIPLERRPFYHGVLDCYTLIRDYYRQELGIVIQDFPRPDDWWAKGADLYMDHYAEAGFDPVPLASMRKHDVVLMALAAKVPNHGGVYLGDGVILHHVMKRLSRREAYAGMWRKITTHCMRHRSLA